MPGPVTSSSPSSLDHFVTTQSDGDVPNAFNLGGLSNGLLKQSVSSGIATPAIAAAGTDYLTSLATNADAPASTLNIAPNSVATATNLVSKSVTISAGDLVKVTIVGDIINNSGSTKTYTIFTSIGTLNISLAEATAIPTSASNRLPRFIEVIFGMHSTSAAWVLARSMGTAAVALGSSASLAASVCLFGVQQSSSNLTGAQTVNVSMFSNVASPTQSFELTGWYMTKIPSNP